MIDGKEPKAYKIFMAFTVISIFPFTLLLAHILWQENKLSYWDTIKNIIWEQEIKK